MRLEIKPTPARNKVTLVTKSNGKPRLSVIAFTVGFCVSLLTSCAALSEEECLYLNWEARGVLDGNVGKPKSKVAEYQKICDRYGIQIDATAYEEGRVIGLEQYCTAENGFKVGLSGTKYENACTESNANAFLRSYRPARRLYVAHAELRFAERTISSASSTISSAEREIDRNHKRLKSEALTDQERDEIEQYNRRLERDIDNARERRITARSQLRGLEQRCREALRSVTASGYDTNRSCTTNTRYY